MYAPLRKVGVFFFFVSYRSEEKGRYAVSRSVALSAAAAAAAAMVATSAVAAHLFGCGSFCRGRPWSAFQEEALLLSNMPVVKIRKCPFIYL